MPTGVEVSLLRPHEMLRAPDDPQAFATGLEALARMSAALTVVDDEEHLYVVASEHIQDLIPVERASIGLISTDGTRFHVRGLHGDLGAAASGEVVEARGLALQAVARSRQYLYAPDLSESELLDFQRLLAVGLRSAIVVPLIAGDLVIGTFNLARRKPNGFSVDEIRLLGHAGQFLALAIMGVRRLEAATNAERASALAHELAAHRVREIESLNRVFRILNEVTPIDERLTRVARELTSLRGVDLCQLALLNDDGTLRTVGRSEDRRAGPGADPGAAASLGPPMPSANALAEAMDQRRPIWSGETEDDGSWTAQQLAIPIIVRGAPVGALALMSIGPQAFGASQGVLAETVSAQIGNALERDQMMVELRRAAETADATSRARSQFLANMSHELRTPMNGVIGMISLLETTELNPQQQMYVEMIRTSGEAQVSVINHILDFSKIEANMLVLQPEPFDLRHCLEDGLDLAAATVGTKPVDLCYQIAPGLPTAYLGDATRIRQVLINLLTNAAKFTDRGEIVVRVDDLGPGSTPAGPIRWLRTSVCDTGPGIPADRIEWLFEPFTQLTTVATHGLGGTGLGLAIARQMVELMGGTIEATSTEGVGSTFQFTLPLPVAPADDPTGAPAAPGPEVGLAGHRVVVASPAGNSRQILEQTLRDWNLEVTTIDAMPATPGAIPTPGPGAGPIAALIVDHKLRGSTADAEAWSRLSQAIGAPLVVLCNVGAVSPDDRVAVLTRPVKPSSLARCLHQALASGSDRSTPATPPTTGWSPEDAVALGRRHPLRVLVAEDNRVNQKVARALLDRLGYEADIAVDGLEAVAAASREPGYDLIFMDLKMPGMDGIEATLEIRRLLAGPQPRIVALTADTVSLVRSSCLDAGMDEVLTKPVRIEALARVLESTSPAAVAFPGDAIGTAATEELDHEALEQLAEVVGHDQGALADIISAFLTDVPALIAGVTAGARAHDLVGVVEAAHPLVSSSATVGARNLSSQAAALVAQARAGEAPTPGQLAELRRTTDRAVAELHHHPALAGGGSHPTPA